ncbi:MAG: MATE family efflux transporter [Ruminococcaceae bacterium]|nr:MATE family efflux transporter [Oscillospiraceae bacterium]
MAHSKNFTAGNIPKQLLLFTLPFMASNALQVLYSTVDMIIVGKYVGTAGLSAVSQSSQILNFATMLSLGFSNAGQVLVSQAMGAGKKREQNSIIGTLFTLILAIGAVLSVGILALSRLILSWINIPQEAHADAMDYLIICGAGLIFTAGYNMVSAVLRGMGDSKSPFLFIGIATFVNLVLDILFTGVLGFGVAGAACATIIGQAVSFLFSLFYLYRRRVAFGFDFKPRSFRPDRHYVGMIFSLGTPMAIQSGCINISMLFVNALINSVGLVESAAFGVGVRIDDIFNKISQGLQYAAMPMISQNIAAKESGRAQRVVWWTWFYSVVFTVIIFAVYLFFGEGLFRLFSDDVLVHGMADTFVAAILWMFPALAIMRGSGAFIQGIGNAKFGLLLSLLDGVVLRICFSVLFGIVFGWGFYGFVLGYGLAAYGFAIPSALYFLRGKWKKQKTLADKM